MKIPYRFDFNGDVKYRKVLSSLPDWCSYHMPIAKSILNYLWNGTEILSQQLNYSPFFTEMVEIKASQTTEIPFRVEGTQIFLFFMLQGKVTFHGNEGKSIISTSQNAFMISIYNSGRFLCKIEKGKHVAFVVNIQRDWLEKMRPVFPGILKAIDKGVDKLFYTLPQYKAGRRVEKWLKRIYEYPETNIGVIDGNQRKYLCFILAYYDSRISRGDLEIAEHLKRFIEENYENPALNVQMIADHFFITRQTLRNHFSKKYNLSVQEYYQFVRMERAEQLIEQDGLSISEVYFQVGYLEENSFRKAYKKYVETQK